MFDMWGALSVCDAPGRAPRGYLSLPGGSSAPENTNSMHDHVFVFPTHMVFIDGRVCRDDQLRTRRCTHPRPSSTPPPPLPRGPPTPPLRPHDTHPHPPPT